MDCKAVAYKIVDFIDRQLGQEEATSVEKHISTCGSCKLVYDETLVLMRDFENVSTEAPSGALRTNFYALLEEEKELQGNRVVHLIPESRFNWKYAFQIAASFLLLFSGYSVGITMTEANANKEIVSLKTQTRELKQNMMLAMIENQSPSKRIQAVSFTENIVKPDAKILEALVVRMESDANNNVRLAAAEALSAFPDSDIVKDAFIKALSVQKEPSIQIAIIQFLVQIQDKRAIAPMKQLLEQDETQPFIKDEIKLVISNNI